MKGFSGSRFAVQGLTACRKEELGVKGVSSSSETCKRGMASLFNDARRLNTMTVEL